jgi:hypothetical protein
MAPHIASGAPVVAACWGLQLPTAADIASADALGGGQAAKLDTKTSGYLVDPRNGAAVAQLLPAGPLHCGFAGTSWSGSVFAPCVACDSLNSAWGGFLKPVAARGDLGAKEARALLVPYYTPMLQLLAPGHALDTSDVAQLPARAAAGALALAPDVFSFHGAAGRLDGKLKRPGWCARAARAACAYHAGGGAAPAAGPAPSGGSGGGGAGAAPPGNSPGKGGPAAGGAGCTPPGSGPAAGGAGCAPPGSGAATGSASGAAPGSGPAAGGAGCAPPGSGAATGSASGAAPSGGAAVGSTCDGGAAGPSCDPAAPAAPKPGARAVPSTSDKRASKKMKQQEIFKYFQH